MAGKAGLRDSYGSADGLGNLARFAYPHGVAVDAAGDIFVADTNNQTVRKVSPKGTNWMVTTLAGMAGALGSADGIEAGAQLNYPYGIAVDNAGNFYVADSGNNTIRRGSPAIVIVAFSPYFGFNSSGRFGFDLTRPAGLSIVVEYSSDLLSWQAIWTNAPTAVIHFTDRQSNAHPNRFYRAHAR